MTIEEREKVAFMVVLERKLQPRERACGDPVVADVGFWSVVVPLSSSSQLWLCHRLLVCHPWLSSCVPSMVVFVVMASYGRGFVTARSSHYSGFMG